MENQADIQIQLFQKIRDQLSGHISLVDEIAEVLEISNDSSYRRIRGEKALSIHEVQKLAGHYNFSVDDLTGNRFDSVTFKTSFLDGENYSFQDWLGNLLQVTLETVSADQAEVLFILNELNIFHIIQFPEVCAFKLFYWQKSNLNFRNYRDTHFSIGNLDEDILKVSREIADHFVKVNTIEFTTEECLNSYLKQVLYYSEAGYFSSRNDATALCDELLELVNHQQKQAELGFKFLYGRPPVGKEGNLRLYHNDIILADNTIIIKAGEMLSTFLTTNAINLMQTHNRAFCEYNYQWGMNLLSKSAPISGTAEKERNRFFLKLREQIDKVAGQL
ncbi:MAG: hypothetical protein ABFS28_13025 [Bacteroidota bacterium]